MQQGENWILQQIFLYSFESFLFYKITSRHLNNETKCHHWIIGSRLKLVLSSLGLGRVVAVQHERYFHWKLKTIFNIPVKRACELTTQATLTRVIRPTVINSHQRMVQILMRVDQSFWYVHVNSHLISPVHWKLTCKPSPAINFDHPCWVFCTLSNL